MSEFFALRKQRHRKRMMKYMRYVLNDHFVLVCLFLLGGAGFYYSNLLKQLPKEFIFSLPIVGCIWWFSLPFGRLSTLVEPADQAFLLPKEQAMKGYLAQALRYSLFVPFVVEGLLCLALLPLVVLVNQSGSVVFFWYVPLLWSLKLGQLCIQRLAYFQETVVLVKKWFVGWFFTSGIVIFIGLYLSPIVGLVAALVTAFVIQKGTTAEGRLLDWTKMIETENNRMHRIYQFINLFTDVPEIEAKVKRRKYLDVLLRKISTKQANTYLFLFARRASRGTEYSGLFVRLVVVGGLFVYLLQDLWMIAGLSVLFIYLIGFQLIPLYSQFDYVSLAQMYPVSRQNKLRALQKLLQFLLAAAALVFLLCAFRKERLVQWSLLLLLLVLEIAAFVYVYVPMRIKKMEN